MQAIHVCLCWPIDQTRSHGATSHLLNCSWEDRSILTYHRHRISSYHYGPISLISEHETRSSNRGRSKTLTADTECRNCPTFLITQKSLWQPMVTPHPAELSNQPMLHDHILLKHQPNWYAVTAVSSMLYQTHIRAPPTPLQWLHRVEAPFRLAPGQEPQ